MSELPLGYSLATDSESEEHSYLSIAYAVRDFEAASQNRDRGKLESSELGIGLSRQIDLRAKLRRLGSKFSGRTIHEDVTNFGKDQETESKKLKFFEVRSCFWAYA